jgi:hypothetical protein
MFGIIEQIAAILSGYGNGKLLERRKGKQGKREKVKDLVCISDEARKRLNAGGNETGLPHADETLYINVNRSGD